jgi:putative protease
VMLLRRNLPELLAPAGNWEALVAAVQNGADAVYMGGTKFSARRLADNFDSQALRKAIEYAHLYGVRIYITVNILIKERELEEFKAFCKELEEYKADGVIVQDIGAARYIAQHHPGLSLHASTQMTIHQLEGVLVLEEIGFDRIVPARELTLEELKYLSDNSRLELETFIHGALCVSYSGQCLMSSMLGGRSGNRGMCAQPCRLAYTLDKHNKQGGHKAYHISMKDLSTLDFLGEILAAGVTGLKIEGRMKRAQYVAVVTRVYRKALDSILETGSYKPGKSEKQELEQIFNRGGFTGGYYYGTDHSDLYSTEKPNHWGVYLGKVTKSDKGMVWVALEADIQSGDAIEFRTEKPGNKGQVTDSLFINGKYTEHGSKGQLAGIPSFIRPAPGSPVYRTSRAAQLKEAEASYNNKFNRKIGITVHATIRLGSNPVLVFLDDKGIKAKVVGEYQVQRAAKRALDKKTIQEQLCRLGDTPFDLSSLELELDDHVFVPVSVLNKLRRDAVNDLIQKRIEFYDNRAVSKGRINNSPDNHSAQVEPRLSEYFTERKTPSLPLLNGYVDHLDFQPGDLEGLDILSYAPASFCFRFESLTRQVKIIQQSGIAVRLVLPTITRYHDMNLLRNLPDEFWSLFDDYQIGNLGQLKLLQDRGINNCFGSHTLNVTNTLAMAQLADLGIKGVTLSPELTIAEIRDIINQTFLPWEILVYGRIVLMTLEYCPKANEKNNCHNCRYMGTHTLTDRKGYTFPVRKKRIFHCYSELLNSQPIFLADNMEPFLRLSASYWGLVLEGLSGGECKRVIQCYRYALNNPGKSLPRELAVYAQSVRDSGFTKGHYFRGVE